MLLLIPHSPTDCARPPRTDPTARIRPHILPQSPTDCAKPPRMHPTARALPLMPQSPTDYARPQGTHPMALTLSWTPQKTNGPGATLPALTLLPPTLSIKSKSETNSKSKAESIIYSSSGVPSQETVSDRHSLPPRCFSPLIATPSLPMVQLLGLQLSEANMSLGTPAKAMPVLPDSAPSTLDPPLLAPSASASVP